MYLTATLKTYYRNVFGGEDEIVSSDSLNRNPNEIGIATNWVNPYITRFTTTTTTTKPTTTTENWRTPRPRSLIYKALMEYQQTKEIHSERKISLRNVLH